jgi:hypothetical protein
MFMQIVSKPQYAKQMVQGTERGAWGVASKLKFLLFSGRQGDKGKWGNGEIRPSTHFFSLSPCLLVIHF